MTLHLPPHTIDRRSRNSLRVDWAGPGGLAPCVPAREKGLPELPLPLDRARRGARRRGPRRPDPSSPYRIQSRLRTRLRPDVARNGLVLDWIDLIEGTEGDPSDPWLVFADPHAATSGAPGPAAAVELRVRSPRDARCAHRAGLSVGATTPADVMWADAGRWYFLGTDRIRPITGDECARSDLTHWACLTRNLISGGAAGWPTGDSFPPRIRDQADWLSDRVRLCLEGEPASRPSTVAELQRGSTRGRGAFAALRGLFEGAVRLAGAYDMGLGRSTWQSRPVRSYRFRPERPPMRLTHRRLAALLFCPAFFLLAAADPRPAIPAFDADALLGSYQGPRLRRLRGPRPRHARRDEDRRLPDRAVPRARPEAGQPRRLVSSRRSRSSGSRRRRSRARSPSAARRSS